MSRRLKMIIAYDGRPYAGWQSQANGNGVQDHIERALRQVTGQQLRITGSGRTDTGVHALGQVAHVDLATNRFAPAALLRACNAVLPASIRLLRAGWSSNEFHARFSAKSKTYRYRIWNGEVLPPLEYGRVWHVRRALDLRELAKAGAVFEGRHDFAGFAARRGHGETNTTRTIQRLQIRKTGRTITVEIEADGFLYRMVRLIVGGLIDVATGQIALADIHDRLAKPGRNQRRPMAPAHGLFLFRVRY